MERLGGGAETPDWHKEIDWNASEHEIGRQISLLYSQTCEDFKDRLHFKGTFHRLTREFADAHPGPEGDELYAGWMITRLRKEFLGRT
jgi:hypothetical protein